MDSPAQHLVLWNVLGGQVRGSGPSVRSCHQRGAEEPPARPKRDIFWSDEGDSHERQDQSEGHQDPHQGHQPGPFLLHGSGRRRSGPDQALKLSPTASPKDGRLSGAARPFTSLDLPRCGTLLRMFPAVLTPFLLAFLVPGPTAAALNAQPSFAACQRLAATAAESEETAKCFEETSTDLKRPEQGVAELRALLNRYPGSPWPTLYLAYLDTDHAEELFRSAAKGFAARHDAKGELLARANVYRFLFNAGRVEEAGAEAERVVKIAGISRDRDLVTKARILKARHLWGIGKDLEQAYLLLRRAEAGLLPGDSYYTKRDCLNGLGNLSLELGRYREGFEAFRRMTELAKSEGDT